MKSKWKVMLNPDWDNNKITYGVFRLYDRQKVMRPENMEIAGYYDSREGAEKEAARLNAEVRNKRESV